MSGGMSGGMGPGGMSSGGMGSGGMGSGGKMGGPSMMGIGGMSGGNRGGSVASAGNGPSELEGRQGINFTASVVLKTALAGEFQLPRGLRAAAAPQVVDLGVVDLGRPVEA